MAGDPSGAIFPRIKTTAFVEAARQIDGMTEDQLPVTREMAGDLRLAFAVDTGGTFTFVTHGLARRRNLDAMALMGEALANLATAAQHLSVKNLGPAFQVEIPNDLSAASYYLHAFWESMQQQLGAPPLAVFAHRNMVAFTSVENAAGRAFLEYAVAKLGESDPHALSKFLYVWRGQIGWTTWPDVGQGDPLTLYPQAVDDWFEGRDASGYLALPGAFLCPSCQNASMELRADLLAQALRARQDGVQRASSLKPDEANAFAAAEMEFTAASREHFFHDLRCDACGDATVIGFEASRGLPGGVKYRPLAVWQVM